MISGMNFGQNYCRLIDPDPDLGRVLTEMEQICKTVFEQYKVDLEVTEEIIRSEKQISTK
mgnify:CR=1 FL=1